MPFTVMRTGLGTSNVMPSGAFDDDGMTEAERQLEQLGVPQRSPVADAHDLEVLREAGGDAGDHVRDQASGQTVQRPVDAFVVGSLDEEHRVLGAGP